MKWEFTYQTSVLQHAILRTIANCDIMKRKFTRENFQEMVDGKRVLNGQKYIGNYDDSNWAEVS